MSADRDRREAFEDLFASHYGAVRGYVQRRSPASAIEDVLAETFLVAWRRLDSVHDDPLPWLLGVARRVLANEQRADRRRDALSRRLQLTMSGAASDQGQLIELDSELADAMMGLSEREREALLLIAWEGLAPRRAAIAAGCSAAAFRLRLYRARAKVTARLGGSPATKPARVSKETR